MFLSSWLNHHERKDLYNDAMASITLFLPREKPVLALTAGKVIAHVICEKLSSASFTKNA